MGKFIHWLDALPFTHDQFQPNEFLLFRDYFGIKKMIECGSLVGSTTRWFCENFEYVYGIEIDNGFYEQLVEIVSRYNNVKTIKGDTLEVLPTLVEEMKDEMLMFYLDSHWADSVPTPEELKIISNLNIKPVICIHDFKVPGHPDFIWDTYPTFEYKLENVIDQIKMIYGEDYIIAYNQNSGGPVPDAQGKLKPKIGRVYIYPKYFNGEEVKIDYNGLLFSE